MSSVFILKRNKILIAIILFVFLLVIVIAALILIQWAANQRAKHHLESDFKTIVLPAYLHEDKSRYRGVFGKALLFPDPGEVPAVAGYWYNINPRSFNIQQVHSDIASSLTKAGFSPLLRKYKVPGDDLYIFDFSRHQTHVEVNLFNEPGNPSQVEITAYEY